MDHPTTARPNQPVSVAHLGQLLFLGAVWGGAFLFLRIAAPDVGAVWAAEIRIAIGASILAVVAGRRTWPLVRGHLRDVAVVGAAFSAIPFTLIAFASLTLPVGYAAVLNAATPIFTAIVAIFWLSQRPTPRLILGLATGLVAVVVLVGLSPLDPSVSVVLAVLAALGAAVSYAFAGTFVRRRLPFLGGLEVATGQLVAGSIVLLPFAIASGPPGPIEVDSAVALLAVGTLSTALPWPIFFRVSRATTPTIASTVTFVVPAFAIVWGALALGEPIGPGLLIGFAIVIVSLVLVLGLGLPRSLPRPRRIARLGRGIIGAVPPARL
jgi:drug/metabolite transporter (DMT)-like permease